MKTNRDLPLDKIKVAAPCSAEWRFMYGDDRVRFCGQCSQNVYNLSEMTREEAEDLIRKTDGQLCVRFYRRKDGTVLTNNCPVGLRAIKAKYNTTKATLLKAVLALLAYLGVLSLINKTPLVGSIVPYQRIEVMGAYALSPSREPIAANEELIRQKAIYRWIPVARVNNRLKGDAVVEVIISEDGNVESARMIHGKSELKALAERTALRWEFEPLLVRGEARRVKSTLTLHFGR